MEDKVRLLIHEHFAHAVAVGNIHEEGNNVEPRESFSKAHVAIEQAVFRFIDENQALRTRRRDLLAKFRSDRPAGSRDQNNFSAHEIRGQEWSGTNRSRCNASSIETARKSRVEAR